VLPIKDDIPTRRFPILTVAIIVACTLVYFAFEHGAFSLGNFGNERVVEYGAIPYEVTHPGKDCFVPKQKVVDASTGQPVEILCEGKDPIPSGVTRKADNAPWWVTVFTSMFMHGGLLHLGGNMLFLWIFGNNIEDSMARWKFVAFYLLGGLAALLAQTLTGPDAAVPTVGASGAIAAVLGGYALLYPRARVITVVFIIIFFTILELPALVVLGLWFLIQLLYGASEVAQPVGGGGGVAYFAHIGGFAFGLLVIKLFADRAQEDYETDRLAPRY
jgi:membrane associated rhomboid family serine protease